MLNRSPNQQITRERSCRIKKKSSGIGREFVKKCGGKEVIEKRKSGGKRGIKRGCEGDWEGKFWVEGGFEENWEGKWGIINYFKRKTWGIKLSKGGNCGDKGEILGKGRDFEEWN